MPKTLTGVVSSTANEKTITVTIHERRTHDLYKKQYSVTKKFRAHDEKSEAQLGDKVEIIESRPISRTKTWKLNKIVAKRVGAEISLKDDTETKA